MWLLLAAANQEHSATDPKHLAPRLILVAILALVALGMYLGRRGWRLPARELQGLSAIEDYIGCCAETGRPVLFTCGGAAEIRRVETFASMPVLRMVAEMAARYGVRLIVPVCYTDALSLHTLAVRDGRLAAGAPEAPEEVDVRFLPGQQFLFAIASLGWMARERPGACIFFGYWEADSLLFAAEGRALDAQQIAATSSIVQAPFFLACCDHVLIGEEFWAASAQISRNAALLGSLSMQDLIKAALMIAIVLSVLAASLPFAPMQSDIAALRAMLSGG